MALRACGHSAGGGHGVRSSGAGMRFGALSFNGAVGVRSFSGARSQGYVNGGGGGGRQARHFRGGRVLGYAPLVGGYAYGGGCAYYYQRAVATGSSYWWDRYYDCAGG
jgi:hypothetical protein